MKLWDKGIKIDEKIEQFTVGNDRDIDIYIAKYDVKASLAHAKMLFSINIITAIELQQLEKGLSILEKQIHEGTFIIETQFEDVHSKIEFELTNMFGEVGKKIHTARSRNDQVLVALQLYYKDQLQTIKGLVGTFFETLLNLAELHKKCLLPGYTHLQVAMPSSFGLWFSSYAELLVDDVYLLDAAIKTIDQNPLGSAAGYGSSFPIDRKFTTKELGFGALKYNVIAAQMGRGKNERTIAAALGGIANTLSRFSMDICLYMSQNFDFIAFPDSLVTGSSIMPHKKNPDVFELIRGKCNAIQSITNELNLITTNLTSGYHRDMQLLKEKIIEGINEIKKCIELTSYSIKKIKVRKNILDDKKYEYSFTVENLNKLVNSGLSFRDAYIKISESIKKGNYIPEKNIEHNLIGSINNLCLDEIRIKMKNYFN